MMLSRTMSTTAFIAVCFSLFCYVNGMSTEMTPTQNNSETLEKTETVQANTTIYRVENTQSSAWNITNTNSTFSNSSTTSLNTPTLTPSTTSTPAGTTLSTVTGSGPSTMKANASSTLLLPSTVPLTGPTGSSENQTYSSTTQSTRTSPSNQTKGTASSLPTQDKKTSQTNASNGTPNGNLTTLLSDAAKSSMKYSEIILTSIFSAILVVVVCIILAYGFKRCLKSRSQYSHHPLRETSYESADRYSPPDDTLVISGGLYDAPRIYNPNMTILEEEESQNDYASFNSRPGQFRLEFLPGDKDADPTFNGSLRRNV